MKSYLNQIFLSLFLLFLGLILLICFTGTFHHIPFLYIFAISSFWLGLFFLLFFLLNKRKERLALICDKWVIFLLFLWAIVLFLFGNYIKGEPASDYWYIHSFLTDWINGISPDWSYFARWENNLPLFYLFAPIAKLGYLLGVTDVQYSLAAFNTILLTGTGYGIYYLIRKGFPDLKRNVVVRWMALLLYMGFIPVWGSVFYVYSDSASMFFAVAGMALYTSKEKLSPFPYFVSGICIGISYLLKPTACFIVLGLWLVQLVLDAFHAYWKTILMSAGAAICIIILFRFSAHFMPHQAYLDSYKMPWQYWVCIGMTKDGTYNENMDSLAVPFFDMNSFAERKEFGNLYIHEHRQNFWNMERILDKTQVNFANGLFGLNEYVSKKTWSVFDPAGTYNTYVVAVFSPYYYVMLLLLWCSGLIMLLFPKSKFSGHDLSRAIMADIIGLILFLFFWETNNRQLYNQMPWFAAGAALSINMLSDFIIHRPTSD